MHQTHAPRTGPIPSQDHYAAKSAAAPWVPILRDSLSRVIVGQRALIDRMLVALLTGGHVLVEGLPGLAKTLTLKTLATSVDGQFSRIQFTPDMMPADVTGTLIFDPKDSTFRVKRGPIFANFVLADEINRAPAKVQAALLEAMQEKQVTIGEESIPLPRPFVVMATQNPVEQEGTYTLPEAQMDRFLMKVVVSYPSREEELAVVRAMAHTRDLPRVEAVVHTDQIERARLEVDEVHLDDRVQQYIVDLVRATREPSRIGLDLDPLIRFGSSPRGAIGLTLAAKAEAFLHSRSYVTPQDVKTLAFDVLRHRIGLTYEAEAQNVTADEILGHVLDTVPVP